MPARAGRRSFVWSTAVVVAVCAFAAALGPAPADAKGKPPPKPSRTPTPSPTPSPSPSPTPSPSSSPTASPTPSPTQTSVLDPSGQPAPGEVAGWTLQLVESFGTPAPTGQFAAVYGSRFGVYLDGWKDTSKNGTYSPSKVISVHDGTMDYYVHTENGVHMVAAVTPKLPSGTGQSYGRYVVRFRNEALPGYKSAWLLWPDSERWPADGEIDFPEADLTTSDVIKAYMHYASTSGGQDRFASTTPMVGDWHTAVTEWSPGSVTFILDGVVLGTSTTKVPTNPMHWVLQTETNLDGLPIDNGVAGHVYVDWVAQYSRVS